MSSLLTKILMGSVEPPYKNSGRLIRFGETSSSALTKGPLNERVMSCLHGAAVPMRLPDIAEAINDYDSRVKKTLNKLISAGLIESIGPDGFSQRFRLR